jgi:hypothetical protein
MSKKASILRTDDQALDHAGVVSHLSVEPDADRVHVLHRTQQLLHLGVLVREIGVYL